MPESPNSTITTRHRGLAGETMLGLRHALHEATQARHDAERKMKGVRSLLARRLWRLRAQARRSGFTAGHRAGRDAVNAIIERMTSYTEIVHAARRDCLDLSVAIAAEIIEVDLVPNTDLLAHRIERAINELLDSRAPRIYVAPTEVKMLRISLGSAPSAAIVPDPSLTTGDAIIETAAGQVRLVWREHLERIRERLIGRVRELPDVDRPVES